MAFIPVSLPRLPFPPSPAQVWAVEDTSAQITWGDLPAGEISATTTGPDGASHASSIEHPGGAGAIELGGLAPATSYDITLSAGAQVHRLRTTTSTPPPGPELFRFATISDLHLGSDHFGASKRMRDRSDHPDPFALRSADDALDAAATWGAQHIVIKGDAAHHGRPDDFALLGDFVDRHTEVPMTLLPGNHDTDRRAVPLPDTVGTRHLRFERHVSHIDVPGLRIVVGDTTIEGEGPGTLERVGDDLIQTAAEAPGPGALIAVHQQLQTTDPNHYWPPGIPGRESDPFLDRLDRARPGAVVTSGHTHRNRRRHHGTLLVTEVAATHHWPGVWAGYVVHEGGIRQVVRRIVGPDIIDWHEYSKNAVLSLWGRYAPGQLEQRCVTHRWVS